MISIFTRNLSENYKYGICKAQYKAFHRINGYPEFFVYWFQIFWKNQEVFLAPYLCCNEQAFDYKDLNADEFEIIPHLLTYVNKPTDLTKTFDIVCKVVVRIFENGKHFEIVEVKPKERPQDGLMPAFMEGAYI